MSGKKTTWVKKSHGELDLNLTNVSSNIIALEGASNEKKSGNISLVSGNDTNITASNLSGTNGDIIVGKYVDLNSPSNISYNPNATLTIQSGQDYHYHLTNDMKIKRDAAAIAVGAATAAAVVVVTGGSGLAVASAAGGGAMVGSNSERGRTLSTVTQEIVQKSSTLNFKDDLNIQSASDIKITASNLKADSGTILAGKFKNQSDDTKLIFNPDADLKLNSAFNEYSNVTTIKQVKPNYVGVAAVAGASAYAGVIAENVALDFGYGNAMSKIAGTIASKAVSSSAALIDPLFNITSKHAYLSNSLTEIKSNLDFNNLSVE